MAEVAAPVLWSRQQFFLEGGCVMSSVRLCHVRGCSGSVAMYVISCSGLPPKTKPRSPTPTKPALPKQNHEAQRPRSPHSQRFALEESQNNIYEPLSLFTGSMQSLSSPSSLLPPPPAQLPRHNESHRQTSTSTSPQKHPPYVRRLPMTPILRREQLRFRRTISNMYSE